MESSIKLSAVENVKNKLKIDFSNGEAAQHVTGSCIYLPDLEILLECGFSQSNNLERDFRDNGAKFNFSCKKLKYIFIGHTHLDHVGRLPLLYKRGCDAPIIASKGTLPLLKNMLEDSAKINERDAELLSKQKGRNYEPIYNLDDVNNAIAHVVEYEQNIIWKLTDELSFRFIPSGHIKFSAQIELFFHVNNCKKKLVYTSDLGNYLLPKNFSDPFVPIEKCDVLIGECTYADGTRPAATKKARKTDLEKIESLIWKYCIDNNAKILIPCFALDRTPELYMTLRSIMKKNGWDVPTLIDSPLSVKQFKIYADEHPELWEEVNSSRTRLCSEWNESVVYQKMEGPMIILSSSGMLTAGRVLSHLPYILPNPNNCILFCGYSTEGTLAWDIKHTKHKTLKLAGKRIANRANIIILNSFSSHMQHDQLLDYYSSIQCNKIYLVHGQQPEKIKFAEELKNEIARKNHTTQVICVNKSTEGRF